MFCVEDLEFNACNEIILSTVFSLKSPFTLPEVNFYLFVILLFLLMRRLLQFVGIRRQISMLEKTAASIVVLPNTGRCVLMHVHLELP